MADEANYQGPGIYQHYKGGIYVVIGLIRMEWNEREGVLYMTTDPAHRGEHFYRGMFGTIRPLNPEDGPDSWNSSVTAEGAMPGGETVPRFTKIA